MGKGQILRQAGVGDGWWCGRRRQAIQADITVSYETAKREMFEACYDEGDSDRAGVGKLRGHFGRSTAPADVAG